MYLAVRRSGAETNLGWPTNPNEVLYEGGTWAETNIGNDDLDVWGFSFGDEIPSSGAEVRGIEVRLDGAWKDEGVDASVCRIGCYLSWDGGTSWTNPKRTSSLGHGTAGEQVYTLGGPDDDWLHTWTLAQIRSTTNFRLRLRSDPKSVIGTPDYNIRWAVVTVYWEKTSQVDGPKTEKVEIHERVVTSITHAVFRERIGIHDRGSSAPEEIRPKIENVVVSGTAAEEQLSSADFTTESDAFNRVEAMGIRMVFGITGPTVYIGNAQLAHSTTGDSVVKSMQPGLVSVGEIRYSGTFGQSQTPASCLVRLQNRKYVDQSAPDKTDAKTLLELAQGKPWVGNHITVWAVVDAGNGWYKRLLFDGVIESIAFEESFVDVHAVQVGSSSQRVPDIYVTEESFSYGLSVGDTGDIPEGAMGKCVPFGLGRFDATARDKETDWETGHWLKKTQVAGGDFRTWSAAAVVPAMFGVKFPMLPTALAAHKWRRTSTDTGGQTDFKSWPYQNVFLFGSRRSTPNLYVGIDQLGTVSRFPGVEWSGMSSNLNRTLHHMSIFTWQSLGPNGKGVGVPFSKEWDTRCGSSADQRRIQYHHSAGNMDNLGFPSVEGATWSDGNAIDAYGVYVNHYSPSSQGLFTGIEKMLPALQTIAIPFQGVCKNTGGTKWYQPDESIALGRNYPIYTRAWQTLENAAGVVDTSAAMDLRNLTSKTKLFTAGTYLCLQMPFDFQNLGKIAMVRLCMAWRSTSTAPEFHVQWRMGAIENRGVQVHQTRGPDFHDDWNAYWTDNTLVGFNNEYVSAMRLNNSADPGEWPYSFASMVMQPYWNHIDDEEFEQVDPTRMNIFYARNFYDDGSIRPTPVNWLLPKRSGDWNFSSWDWSTASGQPQSRPVLLWPWEVRIEVEGVYPEYIEFYGIWVEVTYVSPYASQKWDPSKSVEERQPVYRFNKDTGQEEVVYPGSSAVDLENARVLAGKFLRDDPEARTNSALYVTGRGLVDSNGAWTGVSQRLVENPADMCGVLIHHFLGSTTFGTRAGGSLNPDDDGSFIKARSLLTSNYRLTYICDSPTTVGKAMSDIMGDAMGFVQEQLNDDGSLRYRVFVDNTDPATNDTGRMYRQGGFYFTWNRIVPQSLSFDLTPLGDISSNVRLRYGFHIPSQTFAGEYFCNPSGCNFKTNAALYQVAAKATWSNYKVENAVVVDAPYVWDDWTGDVLAKWYFDNFRRRRAVVEFETWVNGLDLHPGHVIRFDDEIGDKVPWADEGSTNWSDHQFNVVEVGIRKSDGESIRVRVRAVEVYKKAV